jgi:hypothetical protein
MHRATAALVLLAPLVVASGASESQGTSSSSERQSSARFFQVSAGPGEEAENPLSTFEVVEGAFNWRDQTGWAVQRYANASIFWRRVNGACFEWSDEVGVDSEPMKIEANCGLPAIANDPRTTFASMRQRSNLEKIGTEELDGVHTTRYKVIWTSEQEKRVPVELWVDDAEVVRRLRFGREAAGLTIEYLDFGVDAAAEWESPNDPPRWTPDRRAEGVSK